MKLQLPEALRVALLHVVKVFLYSGVSAIVPIIVAYVENDPRYVLFAPVVNALLYGLLRWLKENGVAFAQKLA